MRLVVWNCNMALHNKYEHLLGLAPDIAVIPECANIDVMREKAPGFLPTSSIWIGDKRHKGLGVLTPWELLILHYPGFWWHRGNSLGDCGIGSRLPIQNDRNSRNKLVQEVEVADIPCQYAGTNTPRLKIDERIVEVFPLMTRTLRRAAETKELARKHSRFAPRRRIRSLQAMPRNVFDHIPHRLQNPTR